MRQCYESRRNDTNAKAVRIKLFIKKRMEGFEDFKTIRQINKEKAEKAKTILPVKKSAQKEFIRDLLARNQERFEDKLTELSEYDPKTYCQIIVALSKHMIPKQSEVSVTHGLDEDFKQLAALGMTKINDNHALDISQSPQIQDADFEELNSLGDGVSN